MEIKATNTASLNSLTVSKLQDLLLKLESSLFKAIVTAKLSNDTFAINTNVGKLNITTPLPVEVGDELTLQVKNTPNKVPTLDISKIDRAVSNTPTTPNLKAKLNTPIPSVLISNAKDLKTLQLDKTHFVAKVVFSDKQNIQLQDLKGNNLTLSKDNFKQSAINIQKGELLIIKQHQPHKIEVQQVSKEQVLIQAQRQLVSKQDQPQQTFTRLNQAAFKLFQAINNEEIQLRKLNATKQPPLLEPKHTPNIKEAISKNESVKISPELKNLQVKVEHSMTKLPPNLNINTPLTNKTEHAVKPNVEHIKILSVVKNIKQNLEQLLSTHRITFKHISAESINKLLNDLSIISKSTNISTSNSSFQQKLSAISQTIDNLLNELNTAQPKDKKEAEEPLIENLKASLKEAKQLIESTLQKLLFQSATTKLNHEVSNNVLINTQIPFEIDKQTKDVLLKIKQHKKSDQEQDDAWEIHLSLEMGLLGIISTKIFLKDSIDVSVQFWAEKLSTKDLLDEKKGIFKQQMTNAGFTLNDISIFLGKRTEDTAPINNSNTQFIDINV